MQLWEATTWAPVHCGFELLYLAVLWGTGRGTHTQGGCLTRQLSFLSQRAMGNGSLDIKRWCVCVGGRARLLEHLGQGGGTQQQWAGQQGPSIKIKGRECTGGGGEGGGEKDGGGAKKYNGGESRNIHAA